MPNNQVVAIQSQWGDFLANLSSLWNGLFCPQKGTPYSSFVVPGPPSKITPYVVVPVYGALASRSSNQLFSASVGGKDVVLITGLSHGGPDEFDGFNGEPLYTSSSNPFIVGQEVGGRIVHLLACSTADGLAAMFQKSHCAAFIGYSDKVQIDSQTNAWLQKMLTCDATIESSLIQGKTAAQAVLDAQAAYRSSGLDYIGVLLKCYPPNSQATLPSTGASLPSSAIAERPLATRALPPASGVASRVMNT